MVKDKTKEIKIRGKCRTCLYVTSAKWRKRWGVCNDFKKQKKEGFKNPITMCSSYYCKSHKEERDY